VTTAQPTPTLLPGVPASTWARGLTVAGFLTLPVYVIAAYERVFADPHLLPVTWFVPTAIYGGIVLATAGILSGILAVRARHEGAAGYTTQWRTHPTLPQLDGRTGAVIRAAGAPYVKKSDWRRRSSGGAIATVSTVDASHSSMARPNPLAGALVLLPIVLISAIGGANFVAILGPKSENYGLRVLTAGAFVIVATGLVILAGAAVTAGRLRRLEAAAPGDFVFVFAKSAGYSDGYISLAMRIPSDPGYIARGASADSRGLTVWEENPPERALYLPWSIVTSIQVDTVPRSNRRNNMVLVTFRTEGDELATLPLAHAKISAFPLSSASGVRWIVARLNDLRAEQTTPRVL
jgi:hypothetical protein